MNFNEIFQNVTIPVWVPSSQTTVNIAPLNLEELQKIQKMGLEQKDALDPSFDQFFLNLLVQRNSSLSSINLWDYESIGFELLSDIKQNSRNPYKGSIPTQAFLEYGISIYCSIPKMSVYTETDQFLFNTSNKTFKTVYDILEQKITQSLILEISKYIFHIRMDKNVINLGDIAIEDRIKVLLKIPGKLYDAILESINGWQNQLRTNFPIKFGPWHFL